MESTTRGQSAAAVDDDVGDGRRFPDPPPPHGRDTDSASADMAALVFRREQLLQELHRERIRHDMILCELAETERVMTSCLAGRGAWCGRPLMTPWEETMYRTSRSSEETSWWCTSPSGPVIAPVYPRVERSPSPVLQPRPVDNAKKQGCGPLSVALSAPPDVAQCPSLRKHPSVEEALVPEATNVPAKPAQPAQPTLLSKEVTLEIRGAVDHEHEAGLKDTHALQLMDCEVQRSDQPMHAAIGQECRAEAKDSHAMQLTECVIKRSEQLKRAAVGQERQVDTNVRHSVQVMESKFWRSEQVKLEAVDQEHEAEVNNHEVQLMESGIHRSEQPKCEAFGQQHEAEEKDIHAGQLSKISEEPKPEDLTIKDHTTDDGRRQLPHKYALAGKEKSPPNEQKRLVFNELSTQITPSGMKGRQILRPTVETPPPKRHKLREEWICTHCQVSLRCEEDLTRHQAGDLHRLNLAALQSRQEAAETTKSIPESTYCAPQFHRTLVRPIVTNNLKSEPRKTRCDFGFNMRNHLNHTSHQENTHENMQALHTEGWNHFRDRSHQESTRALQTEEGGKEGSKWAADHTGTEYQRKKFVTMRRLPFCELCKVQCNSERAMESHLDGKKHQERTHALHTEGGKEGNKCAADRTGTEDRWKKFVTNRRFPFCELCKAQCDSEKMMESHLGGRKHRENLQARH